MYNQTKKIKIHESYGGKNRRGIYSFLLLTRRCETDKRDKNQSKISSDSQTVSGLSIKCAKRSLLFHQCPPTTTFLSFSSHHLIVQSLWD